MNFSYCIFLEKIPNVSTIPNLESLVLDFCNNLVEVHHSVRFLDKLVLLSVRNCNKLSSFPTNLKLRSLESLIVFCCSSLKKFPEIECQMKCLEHIDFTCTRIKEPPSSIKYLVGVKKLHLLSCTNLKHLPDSIDQLQHLEILNLRDCEQLRDILRLPPNVVKVEASGCMSLAMFLEEPKRGASPALQLEFLIQNDCPSSLEILDLSYSTIVSLPAWLNKFVGLKELYLAGCEQLGEIPKLPPNIKIVYAHGCTSLKRFQFNNLKDLPMLEWIDFSDCHGLRENMGDDVQIRLMSEGHAKDYEFACIFSRNKILDCFSHCKEVSIANTCEIHINKPVHLDSENTRFVFYAVIRIEYLDNFKILVQVINNGQRIYFHRSRHIRNSFDSDNVYLHYSGSDHSQLKMDNLRVLFKLEYSKLEYSEPCNGFFKSFGFHLKQVGMDGVQLPKRRRDDDGDGDGDDDNLRSRKF